jgi:hypothetical protein
MDESPDIEENSSNTIPPTIPGMMIGARTRLKIAVLSGEFAAEAQRETQSKTGGDPRSEHTDRDTVHEGC